MFSEMLLIDQTIDYSSDRGSNYEVEAEIWPPATIKYLSG